MSKSHKQSSSIELTQAMTLILLILIKGGKHGYAIMTEIVNMTDSEYQVSAGTLYRSIGQMLKHNLVQEAPELFDPIHDDERRKYYKITIQGRQALAYELQRMENLVNNAHLYGAFGTLSGVEI